MTQTVDRVTDMAIIKSEAQRGLLKIDAEDGRDVDLFVGDDWAEEHHDAGGNRNDVTQLMPLIRAIPPVRGRRGRPRRRPEALYADRGYDHDKYRAPGPSRRNQAGHRPAWCRARFRAERTSVEQTFALLHARTGDSTPLATASNKIRSGCPHGGGGG